MVLLTVKLYTYLYRLSLTHKHTQFMQPCMHTLSHAFTYTSSHTNIDTLSYTDTPLERPWLKAESPLSAYHQREIQLLSETDGLTSVKFH